METTKVEKQWRVLGGQKKSRKTFFFNSFSWQPSLDFQSLSWVFVVIPHQNSFAAFSFLFWSTDFHWSNNSYLTRFSRYTILGDKYPKVKSIRYPKAQTPNPNVTVYVVDLSVLKFINKIPIHSPLGGNNSYVTNMMWVSAAELSVTFTNREQTIAMTVLCRAPLFSCREVIQSHSQKKIFLI